MNVGDLFGGGIVFHVFEGGETGLVAALYDQSTSYKWGGFIDGSFVNTFATDTAIGTGSTNTDQIVTVLGENQSAAKLCKDLVLNGFSDWYLPSKDELFALYQNRSLFGPFSASVPYWSSSEYLHSGSYYEKYALRFWNGIWTGVSSENLYRVRAIRTCNADDPINPIQPAPPVLVISDNYDDANVVPDGITTDMEFSLDGAGYIPYSSSVLNAGMLAGDHNLKIRYPAEGINPPSDYIEVVYTETPDEPEPEPRPVKTTIGAVRTIYTHLIQVNTKVATGITGGVYWLNRPKSSTKEDIVVNAVAMGGSGMMQEGVFNVNVHVPNLALATDETQPNFARLEAISNTLVPLLADVWGYDWNFQVEDPGTPVRDGNNWFSNIRIRYWTIKN